MSTTIADLRFGWEPQGPLLSGYDYKFSREAGLIQPGEKRVVQYESRTASHELQPSLLAASVKGVFRSAAAWLVEREAQIVQGRQPEAQRYATCDYGNATPEQWRKEAPKLKQHAAGLCPMCRVFGGSGCLSQQSSNALRGQGIARFHFDGDNDAIFGQTRQRNNQVFAWEEASGGRVTPVISDQLRTAAGARLGVRIQAGSEADLRLAVALLALAADLVSSGFFRFGRFTSRGYGWVQLSQPSGRRLDLADLLLDEDARPEEDWSQGESGAALAQALLKQAPVDVLRQAVQAWMMR